MEVCRLQEPVGVEIRRGHLAECWLHGPEDEIPPDGNRPLVREEIGIADEA